MKTKEELNSIKNEVEILKKKLAELNEEELKEVVGGASESRAVMIRGICPDCGRLVSAKVNTTGTCECGALFCAGFITMFTVDKNNVYLKSFIDVEKYTV